MIDDDDLPVLTRVLRTADPHPAVPIGDEPHARLDLAPFGDVAPPPIAIGDAPQRPEAADGGGAEIVADPRRTDAADAFTLAQDVDGPGAPLAPIDLPALVATDAAGVPETPGHDTEIDFSAPTIAEQVRRAVFDDLAARIDTELDARIAQAMRAEVETAVAQLQERLRTGLSEALRDVVARAVDEEIAKMTWAAGRDRER